MNDCKKNYLSRMYRSIMRGNEIEFIYNGKRYYILPVYEKANTVCGVSFGKSYEDCAITFQSENDFYNASVDNSKIGDVLEDIIIVWSNFDF